MDKQKILIVSRTFYPIQSPRAFRTTELAKEMARIGHEVTVLLPANLRDKIEETFDNIFNINFKYYGPLIWPDLNKSKRFRFLMRKLGRVMFLLFEYPNIEIYFKLPQILKDLKGYEMLISIAVPHENHWAIAKVRSKDHLIAKTWVADCGDPFMKNILEKITPPFYFSFLEKSFLKKADFITVPTKGSKEAYESKFREKFRVIPQGFDFQEVKLIKIKPSHEYPTFAYAGGVSLKGIRSLQTFIDALKKYGKQFRFHIYSSTGQTVLKDSIEGYEESFILHKAIPRIALLFELSKMDFLVNLDNGTHLNTPSKLIDYALCNRPILNINPVNPDNDLILEFLNGNYEQSLIVEDLQKYNIKNVARSFLELRNN